MLLAATELAAHLRINQLSTWPPPLPPPVQTVFLHCDGTDTVAQIKSKLQELLQKVGRGCCRLSLW